MSSNKTTDESKNPSENNASRAVKKTFDLYTEDTSSSTVETTKEIQEEGSLGSIGSLKPELQQSIKKIQDSVKKDMVDKLLNRGKEDNMRIFETSDSSMTNEHKSLIMKKLNKWDSSQEINVANASVVVSWMEKFGKLK